MMTRQDTLQLSTIRRAAARHGYKIANARSRWRIICQGREVASVDKASNGDLREQLNIVAGYFRMVLQ